MARNDNTTDLSQRTIPQTFGEAAVLVESLIETRKLRKELGEGPDHCRRTHIRANN
jgi:hypothetical protein